jgi:hypothetical protein
MEVGEVMSKIDQQIKDLQLKKKKIDYVSYVADLIKNDTKCIDFKEVQKEIVGKIEPFLIDLITAIENDDQVVQKPGAVPVLSEVQTKVLAQVADKLLTKSSEPVQNTTPAKREERKKPEVDNVSHHDKMNFAMNNRHLANKRVQVINDKNVELFGQVVGLDAPFVLVKTDTGPTIKVELEKVVL